MEPLQGLLLWLLLGSAGVWAARLRPMCRPVNATLGIEKEGCSVCITLTTTICAGYCPSMTRVLPYGLPPLPQPVCSYGKTRYDSIRLPNCLNGVDPVAHYPVALSCWCKPCNSNKLDCRAPKAPWPTCGGSPVEGYLNP
ncbi:PREDICTED: lutropin subunit beta [Elephantulus edwardii]|uniref:lutropin subunit beta n=1 Tax=Elephantulus edwardii TaxID=28737 RepID=UPI0003F0A49C|nr:PREDICTED: lutropin subunit beta [Elephantulus edwardii]